MATKVARREVGKAKRIVKKKHQWTVAAGAMGYHAGYDSKEGFYAGKGNHLHRGVGTQPVGSYAIPASSSYVFKPFYTTKAGPRGGLIVCGTQNIGTIASSAAATAGAFTIGGSRTTSFFLSPDDIGGPMALDARKYNFYRFKKVKLILPMNASSTDTYNMAVAYLPDPASATFATIDYNSMQQATDLFVGSRKQLFGPVVINVTMLNKAQFKKYNTEIDTTDSMSIRACRQGVFFGIFDAVDSANLKYGDIVMEYELELYDRCPDYGFTVQISDLSLLSKLQQDMVRIVEQKKSRGDSDESIERQLPRWKSQLRQIDRYIRTHLPSVDDSKYGSAVMLMGPNRDGSQVCVQTFNPVYIDRKVAGMQVGAAAAAQYTVASSSLALGNQDNLGVTPTTGFQLANGGLSATAAVPLSMPVGTSGGLIDLADATSVGLVNMETAAVKSVSGVGAQVTTAAAVASVPDRKEVKLSVHEGTKQLSAAAPPGALPVPEFDEKKLSATALIQLPLLRNLAAMPSDKRRIAMKDIVTYAYDTVRKQFPPIVSEYVGPLRMLAQHLLDMSGAEARRQDDSESSDEDEDISTFVVVPSLKGSSKNRISYGEFRRLVDDEQYGEYQRLRSLARVAQRSYSVDPTDSARRSAMAYCQRDIITFLRTLPTNAISPT